MKITKKKGQNDYTITGLTLGKINFITRAVKEAAEHHDLGPVGQEVKDFLKSQEDTNPLLKTENMLT